MAELALLVAEVAESTTELCEALVGGFSVRQPKTVVACSGMAASLMAEFGPKVVDAKALMKVC